MSPRLRVLFAVLFAALAGCATSPHSQHAHHAQHAEHASASGLEYAAPADPHAAHRGPQEAAAAQPGLRLKRWREALVEAPGGLAYDEASRRLWLVSHGPPANTRGPSRIYELEPGTGQVLASATLPLRGVLGTPVYLDGHLYVGVYHESKLYKLVVDRPALGTIVKTVPVPRLADILTPQERKEVYRYPFFSFQGMVATPAGKLVVHSDDLGELITLDPESGKLLGRVKTVSALTGMSALRVGEHFLVVGSVNPRDAAIKAEMRKFMWRGKAGITPLSAVTEEDGVAWMVLDPSTGEVLASTWQPMMHPFAGALAVLRTEPLAGAPYGRLTLLATAEDGGIDTVEWTPALAPPDSMGRGNAMSLP